MTRETKIGLLVGLAFIIVIGILLSDHMNSTTQPPQAALTEAAPNVRQSVTSLASANGATQQPVTAQPITPTKQVLTQAEIHPPVQEQPTPVTKVEIVGPAGGQQATGPISIHQDSSSGPVATKEKPSNATDSDASLEKWGTGVSEPVTPANPNKKATEVATANGKQQGKDYTAKAGDSVSRIAAKFYGTSTPAGKDAIIKANPSLQKNPDLIVEGHKYVIPQLASATDAKADSSKTSAATGTAAIPETVPVASGEKSKSIPVTDLVDPLPAVSPSKDGGTWYVVKDNDNLWKIAADQLGSGNAWTQIKDLNKDILKGGDTVQPNMRLRIPAKAVANAN